MGARSVGGVDKVIVMPANNSQAKTLERKHPGRMGMMFSPAGRGNPGGLPYVLDNGAYTAFVKGLPFDHDAFRELIGWACLLPAKPLWIVVPDCVGDAVATFENWNHWEPQLRNSGWPLALAVQDGMSPQTVRRYANPDVVFVGGTTRWKWQTVWNWCHEFPRVHVGRVNVERRLWQCDKAGAESVDGTGWFRGNGVHADGSAKTRHPQLRGLLRYLKRTDLGIGPAQKELEFARSFGGCVPRELICGSGRN